jgi:hypothetical protein
MNTKNKNIPKSNQRIILDQEFAQKTKEEERNLVKIMFLVAGIGILASLVLPLMV